MAVSAKRLLMQKGSLIKSDLPNASLFRLALNRPHWNWSILLFISVLLLGCFVDTRPFHGGVTGVPDNRNIYVVDYGFIGNRLIFVVFQKNNNHKNVDIGIYDDGRCDGYVILPDGRKKSIRNAGQMFEYSPEGFKTERVKIAKSQFEAYLKSRPKSYSIESLNRFLEATNTVKGS